MGIEAFCPNGHRVKVKESLAGRKGLCPTCGESFRIPRGLPEARPISMAPALVQTLPRATALSAPTATPPTPAAPSPEPIWHVALPGREPIGPMASERVAADVAAGRYPIDAVVWRDGWPDWRPIGEVFPASAPAPFPVPVPLAAPVTAPAPAAPIAGPPAFESGEDAMELEPADDFLPSVRRPRVIRKRSGGGGVVVSIALLLIVAAAAAIAWQILRSRGIVK